MRTVAFLCLVSLTACPARHVFPTLVTRGPAPAGATVIHDVRVFTGASLEPLEHQDVTFAGDRITALAPTGGPIADGARVIEGAGKTLLPGYVDFHVHLTGSPAPPWHVAFPDEDHNGHALLYSGITSAQDVGGELEAIEALHARSTSGDWLGPRFEYAGPIITPRGGYPASMVRALFPWPINRLAEGRFADQVADGAEAKARVDQRVERGVHHVKVAVAQVPLDAPVYTPELLAEVVREAKAKGVPVVAHIDSAEHALMAARAGVSALVHGVHLGELTEAQAKELKALGVVVSPTLVVFDRTEQIAEFRFAPSAIEKEIYPPGFLRDFAPEIAKQQSLPDGLLAWIRQVQADKPKRLEAVRRLRAAGVPLLVGSDAAGSVGCMAGAAFLEELRLLVEAGVPNAEVLQGATWLPAKFMHGEGAEYGAIAVGKRADLVLVDGNPLEDIAAASRIERVFQAGRAIERLRPSISGT